MAEPTEELRTELLKQIPEEKLESLIKEKSERFHGLLTKEAVLFSISKDLGIKEKPKDPVAVSEFDESKKRTPVFGEVRRIFQVYNYEKNGRKGKLCRFFLGDKDVEKTVVLWNDYVDYIESGKISKGDSIEISGAYIKADEIHLGYGGKIHIKNKVHRKKISELSQGDTVSLSAEILENDGARKYERDGSMHQMVSFTVDDGSSPARLVVWEPNASTLENAEPGDSVTVENAFFKNNEIHAGSLSRVTLSRKPIKPDQLTADFRGDIEGEVKSIQADKEGVSVILEEDAELRLSRDLSLKLLELKSLPDDIRFETLVSIKKDRFIGKRICASGSSSVENSRVVFVVNKLNH